MAKTSTKKVNTIEENIEKVESKTTQSGPSYDELMKMVQSLANEVAALKSGNNSNNNNDDMKDILEALTNKKSDREVNIVNNFESIVGSTHIELSNTTIDFRKLGETRLLSWQQFEECASKYRSFFDRKIIMLGEGEEELAERYGLPCVGGSDYKITQKDLKDLPKMTPQKLDAFISKLSDDDRDMVLNYWLGKCYTREEGFYDRYKIETLNRISEGAFENIIAVMNGDSRNEMNAKKKEKETK